MANYSIRHKWFVHFALAALAAAVLTAFQTWQLEPRFPASDEHGYLWIAYDLYNFGIFGDGAFEINGSLDRPPNPGMFFGPLYPGFLAALMGLDGTFAAAITCMLQNTNDAATACHPNYGWAIPVQAFLAVISAVLVWLTAYNVAQRYSVAWVSMGLALLVGEYANYAAHFLTEALIFPLFTAGTLLLTLAWQRRRLGYWLAAGAFFALAALTRPSFAYVFYAVLPVSALMLWQASNLPRQRAIALWGALIVGYAAIAGPWIARNAIILDRPALTAGYGPFILVQRVSYNRMTPKELGVSFIYWLPDFGDNLAASLFPQEDFKRLSFDEPTGFYLQGNGELRTTTLAAAGSKENHLHYLLQEGIFAQPLKHIAVTFALTWRGMWVGKYWGLIGIPIALVIFGLALRKRWWQYIIFSVPAWFMLGFHAFTSVNVIRYNLTLIPTVAIGMAWACIILADRLRRTRNQTAREG